MSSEVQPPTTRRRRVVLVLVLVLATAVGFGWRYRVTRPDYRFARGEEAIGERDWESAKYYAERLEAAGDPDRAHLLRGLSLHARGFPDLALAELNQIRDEGDVRLRAAAVSGRCLLELGALTEAHRAFTFVLAERPDHADALRGMAAVAYDLGHMGDAVARLERVAELDPADPRPHRLIGLIYKDMGQLPQAVAGYRESLRRNPPDELAKDVRFELAEVLVLQGQFAEALEVLGGMGSAGDEPERVAVRAECLRGVGRSQDAVELIDRGPSPPPTAALSRVRGQLYLDAGRPADAAPLFERAAKLAPADHQTRYLLAQAYSAVGRKDDAARELARAEEIRQDLDRITTLTRDAIARPWDRGVRLQLAELSERLGKPKVAEVWRKAAAACPAN